MTYDVRIQVGLIRITDEIEAPIWTEPVRYETDEPEEIQRIINDLLAAHPEYTRAQATPIVEGCRSYRR